jgi:uncharacterized protein (TIGR02246 family)
MKAVRRFALLAILACPLAWTPPASAADESARIRAGTDAWVKSFNAGNAGAVVALYAEDAVVMPPGVPMARGTAAIKEMLAKEIAGAKKGGVTFVLMTEDEVGMSGDLAWHSGTYRATDKAGKVVDSGKYLETWHKANGKWRIIRDMWNSDGPVAAPAPTPAPSPAAAPKK